MLVYQRVVPVQGTHLWGVVFRTDALMISDVESAQDQTVCMSCHASGSRSKSDPIDPRGGSGRVAVDWRFSHGRKASAKVTQPVLSRKHLMDAHIPQLALKSLPDGILMDSQRERSDGYYSHIQAIKPRLHRDARSK
jgi:hypothetical protein